jgi:hypothetical protein
MKVFLCGHGSHRLEDGFFTLPRGTTVTFYHDAAKLMFQEDVQRIVSGTITAEPARVVEPYKSCPNMTLGEDSPEMVKPTALALGRNPDRPNCRIFTLNSLPEYDRLPTDDEGAYMKLKDIVEAAPGNDFVWTCCYNLPGIYKRGSSLRGWKMGVNQMQYLEGGNAFNANQPMMKGYDLRVENWGDGSNVPTTGKFLIVVGKDNQRMLRIRKFDGLGKRTDFDETKMKSPQTVASLKRQLEGVSLSTPILTTTTTWNQVLADVATVLGVAPDSDAWLDRTRETGVLLNPGEILQMVREWLIGNKLMEEAEVKKLKMADLKEFSRKLESVVGCA